MTTDPIPAPMVQLPAETVEKLREAYTREDSQSVLNAARDLLDAATPAASVKASGTPAYRTGDLTAQVSIPAAAILALANEWATRTPAFLDSHKQHAAEMLDRLLPAAEQADKGEADLFDDLRGHPDDTPMSGEAATQYVPAAPVGEPLCRCGPTPYPGTDAPMEDCPIHYPPAAPPEPLCRCGHKVGHHFAPRNGECRWCDCKDARPARVPVNDEAEAWAELAEIVRVRREVGSDPGLVHVWDKWTAARGEDA